MKTIKKIYYHIDGTALPEEVGIGGTQNNYVKAEVYYSEGGYNLFTYKNDPRGYFMSACMVGRGKDDAGWWETITVFGNAGSKQMIEEVSRQSKKRETNAIAYFDDHIDEFVAKVFPDMKITKEMSA